MFESQKYRRNLQTHSLRRLGDGGRCCIDKENSTELSEAINSMFKWYKRAVKCYVYLRDVLISPVESAEVSHPENAWVKALQGSKWFTRG
jgi:hypothetical protein